MKRLLLLFLLPLLFLAAGVTLAKDAYDPLDPEDMRLLRYPDIHGDRIVFTYAGNLWTVPAGGGEARRLTSSLGFQTEPKFSPDGKHIAFSGNYDGNNDIYVITATGGEPRRLTWHPGRDRVIDWQPDGKAVRFQTQRGSRTRYDAQLYTVPLTGGLPAPLPLHEGGLSSYSPDGKQLVYNRMTREHRTWKRYKGGMAQDLWIYDFDANDTEKVTDWVGTDNFPMWHGETIYYTSDRTGRLQIWAYELTTGEHRQVTRHNQYDVKYPSLGDAAIVYENGGWLYVLDLADEKTRKIEVTLHSDLALTRPVFKDVSRWINYADIAPDGKRVVMSARGDLFSLPAEKGAVRALTSSSSSNERNPAWSPDGKWIACFSDRDGEYDIYLHPSDGKGEVKRLTDDADVFRIGLAWSPDSKYLLYSDAAFRLFLVEIDGGKVTRIDESPIAAIRDYAWSADSRWVAYAMAGENGFGNIHLYDVDADESHQVTSEATDDDDPCFDSDGKYLFFTSDRHFNPTIGGYDIKPTYANGEGIYLLTLRADVENPFPFESDEVEIDGQGDEDDADDKGGDEDGDDADDDGDDGEEGEDDEDAEDDEESDDEPEPLVIDVEGIFERTVALDLPPGAYVNLRFADGTLFYGSVNRTLGGSREDGGMSIMMFDLEEREESTVMSGINGFAQSADGKKFLYTSNGSWGIVDAAADQKPASEPLRTGEMQVKIDPRAEWRQMFRDAWRLERDYFYDPNMHQVDWDKMYKRYAQLLPYVAHGADFSYLLGELLGELNAGHAYVRPGERPSAARVRTGLLGCDFALEDGDDRYRIAAILAERDWNRDQTTPLFGPGIDVSEGDYLLAVDGVQLVAPMNPLSLLENKVGQQVVLTVGPDADGEESREVTVEPIGSEAGLRYEAWVQNNRRRVARLSDGRIGYLHLPNTAIGGMQAFAKGYYPNLRKEGLIIDERYNGGGWVPDFMMTVMGQKIAHGWKSRYGREAHTPGTAFAGHLAMLSNHYAGSGGDALPYYFQIWELGPVIGTRTWGGLIGYRHYIQLLDGGNVTIPTFGVFTKDGEWTVENHGVDPDIDVDELPHEVIDGRDAQIEKAVEYLLEKIEQEPVAWPTIGGYPEDRGH